MDGGISDPIPFEKAFLDGCDRVIVVSTREKGYRKGPSRLMKRLLPFYKKYPHFQDALMSFTDRYNMQMNLLDKYEEEGRVFVFRPKTTDGIKMMEKDRRKLMYLYNDGFNQTLNRIDDLKSYLQ